MKEIRDEGIKLKDGNREGRERQRETQAEGAGREEAGKPIGGRNEVTRSKDERGEGIKEEGRMRKRTAGGEM